MDIKNNEKQTDKDVDSSDEDVIDDVSAAEDEVIDPQEQIKLLNSQVADYHNRLLRSHADMDNLRKRTRRDVEDALVKGRSQIVEDLLPAIDSIDLALKSTSAESEAKAVYDGMIMVRKQFASSMEKYGLKSIETSDVVFDPAFHEAIAQLSSDKPTGIIINEMRKGYLLGERLLRASMVIVSSGKKSEEKRSDGNNKEILAEDIIENSFAEDEKEDHVDEEQ